MKVLLTGFSGFIGKEILVQLHSQNIETIVVGRKNLLKPYKNFIYADLFDSECSKRIICDYRPTHLIHLAWCVEHDQYWTSRDNIRWVEATSRIVEEFCREGGEQVIAAGTCAEYEWSNGYCREDFAPIKPKTLYGVAKDTTRQLITAICQTNNTSCAWGRIFIPYGPGENEKRLIPALYNVFMGRIAPFGVNATAYRDFIHVEDVAGAFLHLLKTNANGIFNISSGEPTRISILVDRIAQLCNADPNRVLKLASMYPNEPQMFVGDSSKLRKLGWEPKHQLALDLASEYKIIPIQR